MTIPHAGVIPVTALRETLGLSAERPVGVRDVIAIPRFASNTIPEQAAAAGPLALGDWPETWRSEPGSGPRYLVTLYGPVNPYEITGIWETDPAAWGQDSGRDSGLNPFLRLVPLSAPAYVASVILAGQFLDTGLSFGWTSPEEQFAFL
jgi:hypothetical protein